MTSTVELVLEVLEEAGFERLPTPLVVAGSKFEFDGAVRGTHVSHDLVLVAGSSQEPKRLVRLLSALSRTLDQVESRRPVSLVLVGEPPERSAMADLERHARVLMVTGEVPSEGEVRRAVSVLMPLDLPSTAVAGREPLAEVAHVLGRSLSEEHQVLIDAARFGSESVRSKLVEFVDAAIDDDPSLGGDL